MEDDWAVEDGWQRWRRRSSYEQEFSSLDGDLHADRQFNELSHLKLKIAEARRKLLLDDGTSECRTSVTRIRPQFRRSVTTDDSFCSTCTTLTSLSLLPVLNEFVGNGGCKKADEQLMKNDSDCKKNRIIQNVAKQCPTPPANPFSFPAANNGPTVQQQQELVNAQNADAVSSKISSSSSSSSSSTSHRTHRQVTTSSSEMMTSSVKSDLSELKSSLNEMKDLSKLRRASIEDVLDRAEDSEPVITYPESPQPEVTPSAAEIGLGKLALSMDAAAAALKSSKVMMSEVKESKEQFLSSYHRQQSHIEQEQKMVGTNMSSATQKDGIRILHEAQNEHFSAEKTAAALLQQQRQFSKNRSTSEKHCSSSSMSSSSSTTSKMASNFSTSLKDFSTSSSHVNDTGEVRPPQICTVTLIPVEENVNAVEELTNDTFDDLEDLANEPDEKEATKAIGKYTQKVRHIVSELQRGTVAWQQEAMDPFEKYIVKESTYKNEEFILIHVCQQVVDKMCEMMRKAWMVPKHGHLLGTAFCDTLRNSGCLDVLIDRCSSTHSEVQFSCAKLLEQCLTTENRTYVVENGLNEVVYVATQCAKYQGQTVEHSRVSTGILEHLFKHSEETCEQVICLGGLETVIHECRKNDVETLRHCASALANLSLYGGADNHENMIKRQVPLWLFPLAFHTDDNVQYYACLAIAVLVANKEIEASVLDSGTLDLVEPFVTNHHPDKFAKSYSAHAHGQSKSWLQRLVPVLSSIREEARNLAAFHFCMEAGIKKRQNKTEIFREIGAVESLKKVASCPNAIASKFAAQALRLVGEEVPHKLSQQVPLWSVEDVRQWVIQVGFCELSQNFVDSRVDGDLLLQLTDDNLFDDLGMKNGIQRRRFMRELQNLKKMADYRSRDAINLNNFLLSIGPEFSIYTYSMINAGVDKDSICSLTAEQLFDECGIRNGIHRLRILDRIKQTDFCVSNTLRAGSEKPLDVFISYRRSNGSQLASLLKVHLQVRNFSVFIDVEKLEAGKFDNNLLQSIKHARNFLLVLTPNALDRCLGDSECKDWVHREIVAALQAQCNIVPITDNFQWPEPEHLPEDMRAICHFNGIRWIHDYQDACVDKLERFMKGEGGHKMDVKYSAANGEGQCVTPRRSPPPLTVCSHPPADCTVPGPNVVTTQ